jgi:hypothetical protein
MYDKYDLLLASIPTTLLFGIVGDMLFNSLYRIPLIASGIVGIILMGYAIYSVE